MNALAARQIAAIVVGSLVGLVGCGSSGDSVTPETVERDLPAAIAESSAGSDLRDIQCIAKTDLEYLCRGEFEASMAFAKESMGSIDTSNFRSRDWQVIIEQNSGPVSYTITVDPDTGEWIAE